jgi:hypothetical protein
MRSAAFAFCNIPRARAREFFLAAPLARPNSLASLDTLPDIFA